ncbi:hypothetical protein VTO73DRAFT_13006 [Trametes versicolor]
MASNRTSQQSVATKYMLEVDGDIFIGIFTGYIESVSGPMLKLVFRDRSTWAQKPSDCVQVKASSIAYRTPEIKASVASCFRGGQKAPIPAGWFLPLGMTRKAVPRSTIMETERIEPQAPLSSWLSSWLT